MTLHHPRAAKFFAAFFLIASVLAVPAHAAARLSANPIQLSLPASALSTTLTLRNLGAEPVTLQSEIFDWQQPDGQDRLTPTRELLVSPPIVSIGAGQTQVIRVGRLRAATAGPYERAFRIEISEVPSATALRAGGVATLMKLSLPIFVPPARADRSQLQFNGQHDGASGLQLEAKNLGNRHVKLVRLELEQAGQAVNNRELSVYVLPGSRRDIGWPGALQRAQPGQALQLTAQLDNRTRIRQPLPLGAVSIVPQR